MASESRMDVSIRQACYLSPISSVRDFFDSLSELKALTGSGGKKGASEESERYS